MAKDDARKQRGGVPLTAKIRHAMARAMKQGEAGVNGQRSLSVLLAELMQSDPAKFLQVCAPYLPKEIVIDQTISIADALAEARRRVIDMGAAQLVEDQPTSILAGPDPLAVADLVDADQSDDD